MYLTSITDVDEDLGGRLSEGLEFIRWRGQVRRDFTVFVKPNFTYPHYKKKIVATQGLLSGLLEMIEELT